MPHPSENDQRSSYSHHPVDDLEPVDSGSEYREAAIKSLAFLRGVIQYLHDAKTDRERGVRLWAISLALGHPATGGRSQAAVASALGVTRAALSKHIVTFERGHNLPPAFGQKSEAARKVYSQTRKSQLS